MQSRLRIAPLTRVLIQLALVGAAFILAQPSTSQNTSEYSSDGAWNWFTEPRALRHNTKTYVGWVDRSGSVVISSYDHISKTQQSFTLKDKLQKDDHNNPSLLVLPDNRLMAFYSAHSGQDLFFRTSRNPEDISAWEPEQRLGTNTPGERGFTYPNPILLSGENITLYLFWRGGNWQPTFATSKDNGITWSSAQTLISHPGHRPYIKYVSDGVDTIHFAYSEGHPRDFLNNVYYGYYKNGTFYYANGSVITDMNALPFKPEAGDKVYDVTTQGKAWVWDIALDQEKHPVIVYATFANTQNHQYHYARWGGTQWINHPITTAGTYIDGPGEPFYSGGVTLDHADPAVVYLSQEINGVHEIEKWTTPDHGASWSSTAITASSGKKNVRPVSVWGETDKKALSVLWMHGDYISYTNYLTGLLAWPKF